MNIIVAGDFCPRARTQTLVDSEDYSTMFADLKSCIESADYSLVNFECPIVSSSTAKPLLKLGPNLKTTRNAVDALLYCGFKGVTLANNHVMDYGSEGLLETMQYLTEKNVDYVGAGCNLQEASQVLYKNVNGVKIAFISCCEHEFSIATPLDPGANPLDTVQQYYQIREAKRNADYVFVIVHGGHEMFQLPSPRMKSLYRFYIDCGADVVINHHQHCYSGYELYQSKLIFYGIGNFCFDNNIYHSGIWTQGYLVDIKIDDGLKFNVLPYIQCAEAPCVKFMEGKDKLAFEAHLAELNSIIQDDEKLYRTHKEWMDSTSVNYMVSISPYSNKYTRLAARKGYIPMLMPQKKLRDILNCVNCESHRDRLINMLTSNTRK